MPSNGAFMRGAVCVSLVCVAVWGTPACRSAAPTGDEEPGVLPDTNPSPSDTNHTGKKDDSLTASVRAYVLGPLMYLEHLRGDDTIRLGLDTRWGGSIVELSWGGVNVINADDTGREIQAAFYDGADRYDDCAGCGGNWGWDPVQGGDIWNAGSPVLASSVAGDSLYVQARPLEWFPDDKGGGPGNPVESDVVLEQWVAAVPTAFPAFRVTYRMTHRN